MLHCFAFPDSSQYAVQVTSTIRNAPRLKNIFQACSSLELLTYPETRFAYALLMLERFQKVKRALIQTVKSSDWETYKTKQYVSTLCVWKEHVCFSSLNTFVLQASQAQRPDDRD
jgi:hypothetical protein